MADGKYDFLVLWRRLQPLELADEHLVNEALVRAHRVILLVGSANLARSSHLNPFTFAERAAMVRACWRHEVAQGRLVVGRLDDVLYDDAAWRAGLRQVVEGLVADNGGGSRIGIACYGSEAKTDLDEAFPHWERVAVAPTYGTFDQAGMRDAYFRANPALPHDVCPPAVVEILKGFRLEEPFSWLAAEAESNRVYHRAWENSPYTPVFVTVDPVVVQGDRVLLIRRGGWPGKGLLALPGGFMQPGERLLDGCIRELREETEIADGSGLLSIAEIARHLVRSACFDMPTRDGRGVFVTQAFLFRMPDSGDYTVEGADDAKDAHWARFEEMDPGAFYSDHYYIIRSLLATD